MNCHVLNGKEPSDENLDAIWNGFDNEGIVMEDVDKGVVRMRKIIIRKEVTMVVMMNQRGGDSSVTLSSLDSVWEG